MSVLLDAGVLVALAVEGHLHHAAAGDWFTHRAGLFATCPTSQGALIRLMVQPTPTSPRSPGTTVATWRPSTSA